MEMGSKFTLNPHEIHTKFGRQFRRNSQGDFSHDFSKFTRDFGHGFRREGGRAICNGILNLGSGRGRDKLQHVTAVCWVCFALFFGGRRACDM